MPLDSTTIVRQIGELHATTVARWHQTPPDNPYTGLLSVVCKQHSYNFLLWHEEDVARRRDVPDARIAEVKRAIDGYNPQRNDWIERIDETLLEMLAAVGVEARDSAPMNTETPGSAIDRLSILALRSFHLEEELARDDVDDAHRQKVGERIARCGVQRADLSGALAALLADVFAGRKRLRVYRQMKMYNDPTLNPHLYRGARAAG